MKNYIYLIEARFFDNESFILDVMNNKLNSSKLISIDNHIKGHNTGYYINNNICYQMMTNVIKDNINYIASINRIL